MTLVVADCSPIRYLVVTVCGTRGPANRESNHVQKRLLFSELSVLLEEEDEALFR
jgi:hypothetical protein